MQVNDENSRIRIQDLNPDPLVRGMDPRIRIRIHPKMSWIRNTGFWASWIRIRIRNLFVRIRITRFFLGEQQYCKFSDIVLPFHSCILRTCLGNLGTCYHNYGCALAADSISDDVIRVLLSNMSYGFFGIFYYILLYIDSKVGSVSYLGDVNCKKVNLSYFLSLQWSTSVGVSTPELEAGSEIDVKGITPPPPPPHLSRRSFTAQHNPIQNLFSVRIRIRDVGWVKNPD